jgi:hypothetical protein
MSKGTHLRARVGGNSEHLKETWQHLHDRKADEIPWSELSRAQKNRETFAEAKVLASRLRILEMFPSTRHEHDPDSGCEREEARYR